MNVCKILEVDFYELLDEKDARQKLKLRVIEIQEQELFKRMVVSSKMDGVLLNGFMYNGKTMKYMLELEFLEARAIFMVRYRMLPTKANFPGRWNGTLCNVCHFDDNDEHIFHCPGYQDIVSDEVHYSMFWDKEVLNDTPKIKKAAGVMIGIIERLNEVQSMSSKGDCS